MGNILLKLHLKFQDLMTREQGQELTEFAMTVALVALGATAGMQSLASGVNTTLMTISSTLSSSL